MNIAIIGGGFTGLTAAYELGKLGHKVTVFEKDATLGGLANGFKEPHWDWHLEMAYHHLFTNDNAIISLIKELGLTDKLIIKRPITANFYHGAMYQFDSAMNLLQFPHLSVIDKIRTGALAAFCKIYPFWQTLEGVTAKEFFTRWGGAASWRIIWEPLMTGKFGKFADTIAASWLWARIHKRTPSLIYIEGGFQTLINALALAIKKQGGKIHLKSEFKRLDSKFDRTLLTIPTPTSIPHLHAQILILETKEPILKDVYWLSITDRSFPFLAVVAHTNLMDKKHYGGNHITYIGNYLPDGHPYLSMTKEQLLAKFMPFLKRISNYELRLPAGKAGITNFYLFIGKYAQPVHQINYSQKAPKLVTQIPGVYLANMDSIYPCDRGTNYAVELGIKAAAIMSSRT